MPIIMLVRFFVFLSSSYPVRWLGAELCYLVYKHERKHFCSHKIFLNTLPLDIDTFVKNNLSPPKPIKMLWHIRAIAFPV